MSLSDGSVLTGRIGQVHDGTVDIVVRQVKKGPVVREVALDVITKAVVQVEFSSPSPRELELAGVSGEEPSA
jgi:ribosome maturation factor RimP